jgi:glutamate synthase (NADPH/NADH) small chain
VHRRLDIPDQPVPKQAPEARIRNWNEVFLGYTLDLAQIEAERCINCPTAPCQEACPAENDIPAALRLLEGGDVIGAANKFRETNFLPDMCGRLCPQEKLCEGSCVVGFGHKPVAIGKLEAFVADYQRHTDGLPVRPGPDTGRRVAVVGSGPAGLAVAEGVREGGHAATVYDAWPSPGGVLRYGIPNFKLWKDGVDAKIAQLEAMGVAFVCDTAIGRDVTVDDLLDRDGFDAVFLGAGAGVGGHGGVPGEDLDGIYLATDFLVRANLPAEQLPPGGGGPPEAGRRVAVIGGGDTSMDCVRSAMRLGADEVILVYRRTENEMRGREEERRHAREEGVRFEYLTTPTRYIGDETGHVRAIECQRLELGDPDASGRRSPQPVAGSEFVMDVDTVVLALGYSVDSDLVKSVPALEVDRYGLVRIDRETGRTSRPGVFAGGDVVNGADLVVTAMADGRRAAAAINRYLAAGQAPRPAAARG